MGKYHPHGDSAIYDTVVRMAQDFSLRYLLVDGQGNFGSIDGDNPAAMRYTEVRLTKLAEEMLKDDIDKETVEWGPNYDGTEMEPLVLPAKVPNLLINGGSGIAVGMATNIPPHNLGEVCDALMMLIDDPETPLDKLMRAIPGPDFPTAGFIHGLAGIRTAYETGRGIIQMRARAGIETTKRGGERQAIIVTEIPYQVNKARLIEKIAELVREKRIEGISDLRDESDREGIRIVIEVKRGEVPEVILNQLYKLTQMQSTFGIIFLADRRQPAEGADAGRDAAPLPQPPQDRDHPAEPLRPAQGRRARPHPGGPAQGPRPPRRGDHDDPPERQSARGQGTPDGELRLHPAAGRGDPRHAPAAPHRPRAPEDRRRVQGAHAADRDGSAPSSPPTSCCSRRSARSSSSCASASATSAAPRSFPRPTRSRSRT